MRFTSGWDTLANPANWESLFAQLPAELKSPFFSPRYYRAYQSVEKGDAVCFWAYQDACNYLFYPCINKSINRLGYDLPEEYGDISGAYGYNGPLGMASDADFVASFNHALESELKKNNVVTEFVRYCPIIGNRQFHTYTQQINVLDNVYIDLTAGAEHVWESSFHPRVRKTIRKGLSYNLRTEIKAGPEIDDADIQMLFDIYTGTMDRNDASEFYYFDRVFFDHLVRAMGEMVVLAITYLGDQAISTELVMLGDELAFGFLGGTRSDFYQYKANTFQRWELVKYLVEIGVKKYSMGGGATRGDSIYDFKMSFAQGCDNPFFIGIHVHLPEVYQQIKDQWASKYPAAAAKYAGLLQGYRHQS